MTRDDSLLVVRPAGAHGLLVEVADSAAVRQVADWISKSEFAAVLDDVVPGGRTVLVRGQHRLDDLTRELRDLAIEQEWTPTNARTVEIPVVYAGDDLDEVCQHAGVNRSTFVAQHTEAEHTVAFFGFTPGFPYISGVPESLHVPRRATPRATIPAGAVAVANDMTVVYPGGTPGGWNIIGRTSIPPLWDLEREPPNLFSVGDRIVFREAR